MDVLGRKIKDLRSGRMSEKEFISYLRDYPFSKSPCIKLDFHRKLRRGVPEVIYGRGKSPAQLQAIIRSFQRMGEPILVTKVEKSIFAELSHEFPNLRFHEAAQIITFASAPSEDFSGKVLVLSGGAADEPVAEEAYVSASFLGNPVDKEYDVGVACLPRILELQPRLNEYVAVIAVAGMEGALPSVVAGMTSTPVIAVPTSVGYGANFSGVSALLSMLNSCSGGIAVVNIDNGFGAAYLATLINQKVEGVRRSPAKKMPRPRSK